MHQRLLPRGRLLTGAMLACPACGHRPAGPAGACSGCLVLPRDQVLRQPGLVALGRHEAELKLLIRALKFGGSRQLARPLGAALAAAVRQHAIRPLAVTFVPLHSSRQALRGYNQAEVLAGECAAELGIPCLRLLVRPRRTAQQARLATVDRPGNAAGAFALAGTAPRILPRRILLVDDVMTTGSTLEACRQALMRAGSQEVIFAVLATARPRTVITA